MKQESSNREWHSVGFGKIRRKARADDPKAVERILNNGEKTYAIEYNCIGGILDGIRFKDDERYGKSWTLFVNDGDEQYAIQVSENTRYASDLMKRIPNLVRGEWYKFTPYDFEKDGKRKQGFSIKTADDQPVDSFYEKFTKTEDGWKVELLNGMQKYEGDSKDKDELKIYFMRVTKFLRDKALAFVGEHFAYEKHKDALQKFDEEIGCEENVPIANEENIPF